MSSTINLDMTLLAASNIVPQEIAHNVFLSCVKEMEGEIRRNNFLTIQGKMLGRVMMGQRIVLQYDSDSGFSKKREDLRALFTRRIGIAQADYLHELEENKRKLSESRAAEESLFAELAEIEKKKQKSLAAMQRQEKPSCEAIKDELCEAAEMKGYDVIEEKTDQGIQLQFVRREY